MGGIARSSGDRHPRPRGDEHEPPPHRRHGPGRGKRPRRGHLRRNGHNSRQAPLSPDQAQPGGHRGRLFGPRPRGDTPGGGDRADRSSMDARGGVLLSPGPHRLPGELAEGGRPAPLLVPPRQVQRHRRRDLGPPGHRRSRAPGAPGASRRRAGGAQSSGPGRRCAHRTDRQPQDPPAGAGPPCHADRGHRVHQQGRPRRFGRARALRRPPGHRAPRSQAPGRLHPPRLTRPARRRPGDGLGGGGP